MSVKFLMPPALMVLICIFFLYSPHNSPDILATLLFSCLDEQTSQAAKILANLGTPCLIHQPVYNMFNRWIEDKLLKVLEKEGMGCIVFSPLAQGLLTDKYIDGIPKNSRAASPHGFLQRDQITREKLGKVSKLNSMAHARDQSLAQLALAWVLRHESVTSALIGASNVAQIEDCIATLKNLHLSKEELKEIDTILLT